MWWRGRRRDASGTGFRRQLESAAAESACADSGAWPCGRADADTYASTHAGPDAGTYASAHARTDARAHARTRAVRRSASGGHLG